MKDSVRTPLAAKDDSQFQQAGTTIVDRLSTGVWIFDIDHGRVIWANRVALEIWAAPSLEELCSRDMKKDMSPAVARRLRQYQVDFIETDASFNEMWTVYPRGVPRPLDVRFRGFRLADGRMAMLCEGRDQTGLQPETIRSADALLHTQLMISLHTQDGQTLYCNPSARASYELHAGGLQQRFVRCSDYEALLRDVTSHGEAKLIAEVLTSQGRRWHELIARACFDPVSGKPSLLISESDVTELKEAEAIAQRLAHHDPLTGLQNRLALSSIFAEMARKTDEETGGLSMLFIDLDQFKAVNDTLGHLHGDKLLRETARRLREFCREEGAVVRLGGDEFLLLVRWQKADLAQLEALTRQVIERLSIVVQGERHEIVVTPSIGIANYPEHGRDAQSLMRMADLAMYQAKALGRNQFFVYEDVLSRARDEELEMLTGLRDGLRRGDIIAHYQPRINAATDAIVAVEALARWDHPVLGIVSPARFIPLAEKAGLIGQVGAQILEQGLRQRQIWAEGGTDLTLSVNLSLRQLCDPDFAGMVAEMLTRHQCPPDRLELELTETLFSESNVEVQANVTALRRLGIRIAIDDFGTGYSNIARLNDMAVDCIKIDRSLISGLPRNEELVRLVIAMCNLMQVTIVAEGVETDYQRRWACRNGVDELQGYFFSAPVPADRLQAMLRGDQTRLIDAPSVADFAI